jgi:hypothetical protein
MYSAYTETNSFDIPEANTILEEFETKFYFRASNDKIEQFGSVSKNNTITKYDKPFVKMVFPFNYGDTYSGNFLEQLKTIIITKPILLVHIY